MKVTPSVKQIDGVAIPTDWDVRTMDELTTLMTNGFVGTATTAYVDGDEGVLYIQGYNVRENEFNFHGIKRVSKAFHARHQKSCLRPGDLLTVQTGDIGVTAVVPPDLSGANCHALVISRFNPALSDPQFFCQYFNSERGRARFKEIETGSTMKHLNVGDMKQLLLPLPPIDEQRAIATALSDVDALIAGLERLITKKRDIKQAAMQQLLTGQTRLPGFSGEWISLRLGELLSFKNGLNKAKEFFGEGTPIVNYMDVFGSSKLRAAHIAGRVTLTAAEIKNFDVRKGDVFFTRTSETSQEIGIASVMLDEPIDTVFSGFVLRGRPSDRRLHCEFSAYCFQSEAVRKQIIAKASYTTRALTNGRFLSDVMLNLPSIPEQTAIAIVLSDMDAELSALDARLTKTRAIKQGMMQELLTGRTRLI